MWPQRAAVYLCLVLLTFVVRFGIHCTCDDLHHAMQEPVGRAVASIYIQLLHAREPAAHAVARVQMAMIECFQRGASDRSCVHMFRPHGERTAPRLSHHAWYSEAASLTILSGRGTLVYVARLYRRLLAVLVIGLLQLAFPSIDTSSVVRDVPDVTPAGR